MYQLTPIASIHPSIPGIIHRHSRGQNDERWATRNFKLGLDRQTQSNAIQRNKIQCTAIAIPDLYSEVGWVDVGPTWGRQARRWYNVGTPVLALWDAIHFSAMRYNAKSVKIRYVQDSEAETSETRPWDDSYFDNHQERKNEIK